VKFKTDENLPIEAAATLREAGFDAETIWDEKLSGADDQVVASTSRNEGRNLLTLDLVRQHSSVPTARASRDHRAGLKYQDKLTIITYVRRLAAALARRSPAGELWIVEGKRIRFRGGS
jgi:hypothetical protein